jgi:hypothetical protein
MLMPPSPSPTPPSSLTPSPPPGKSPSKVRLVHKSKKMEDEARIVARASRDTQDDNLSTVSSESSSTKELDVESPRISLEPISDSENR